MNVRAIAITSSLSVCLLAVLPVSIINFPFAGASTVSRQTQKTVISLSSTELKHPLILRIGSAQLLTQATGEISINGRLFKKLSRTATRIDLAPYLKLGKNIVAVSGQYSPASAAIDIEFISSNNHVSQKMAGSGTINQILAIEVQ
jgi:hypothetical protein